jgi:hypothetical protein
MRNLRRWIYGATLAALVAVACTSSSGSDTSAPAPVAMKEIARQDIGPAGGTITGGAVTIEIPAGALTETKSISINEIDPKASALPQSTRLAGALYALLPDDVVFQKPATVTVKIDESKKRPDGKGAVVLFRAASGTNAWTAYGADQTTATTLAGKTTKLATWAATTAAESTCFLNRCAPIIPPGPPDPSILPGLDCRVPMEGAGVHCVGRGPDKGLPFECFCDGSDTILGTYQRLPPDTAISAMAAQCGGVCPPGSESTCELGLVFDPGQTGTAWSASTTKAPIMKCSYDSSKGTTCSCDGGETFSIPSLTQLPTNNDLFSAWAGSCEGVCDTDGGAPAGDWVCPGSIEFPNDGGVGCIVESAGTCRDNNFYGFECDTTMSPSTTCTCKTNGVENGKVVQSNCRDGWVACEFPKYQGQ